MKNYFNELVEETPATPEQLLEEIQPLLQEYFVGEISRERQTITYLMPNGCKYILTAERVAKAQQI